MSLLPRLQLLLLPLSLLLACSQPAPPDPPGEPDKPEELKGSGTEYHFNWKTESSWIGTCRQLIIRLQDVADPVAYFRFE